jgi:hypothetical protein
MWRTLERHERPVGGGAGRPFGVRVGRHRGEQPLGYRNQPPARGRRAPRHRGGHLPGHLLRIRHEIERHGSLYKTLREAYGIQLTRAEDVVDTALASPREADRLGVDPGVPLLAIHRTAFDGDDTPIEYTRSVFRGDRFRFVARSSIAPTGS